MTRAWLSAGIRLALQAAATLLVAWALACTLPEPARAGGQVPLGPRALAMGGAYSAIANDASALFWNPAGLVRLGRQEIAVSHADLFGSGIKDDVLQFVLPLTPSRAVGVDWFHSGYADDELDFGEDRFDVGVGMKFGSRLAFGVTGKYVTRGTDLDGFQVRQGHGLGLDLGLLAMPWERLSLGLVAQDVFDTKVSYTEGGTSPVATRQLRAGVAYEVSRAATLAADVDDRFHLGTEIRPFEALALRAGLERDRTDAEGTVWTTGAGFKVGIFRVDYAMVSHPTLATTHHFGLAMNFNFNPAQVRIEKAEVRDIYSSLYKSYARDSVAVVQVQNLEDRPLTTRLGIFLPGLMDAPTEREVVLRPRATQGFPLPARLSERVLGQGRDNTSIADVQVTATYQSAHLPRTEKRTYQTTVYGPGAINWGAGTDQAAAYITTQDPVVKEVALTASRTVALLPEEPLGTRNLGLAAGIFEGVGAMGVAYVPDPLQPYEKVSGVKEAVDNVSYPRETLRRKSGDCDDSSVLLAALFGSVGIATKLVDAPGHLFLLLDSGIHERNRLALQVPENRYVVLDDGLWIPLETTALGKSFVEAWRIGAQNYNSWASRGRITLVDVAEAQERYEPGEAPGDARMATVDTGAVRLRVARDAEEFASLRSGFLASQFQGLGSGTTQTGGAPLVLAHLSLLAQRYEEALARLQGAPQTSAAWHNDLAVVLAAQGDVDQALVHLRSARELDRSDPGILLNLGLLRYASGDTTDGVEALAEGVSLAGGFGAACRMLGLPHGTEEKGATRAMSAQEIRQLLHDAMKQVPRVTPARAAVRGQAAKPPTAGTLARARSAGARSASGGAIEQFLYWKN
jgi:hypothetical protein